MAQERPNRFAEWVALLRQNAPMVRDQLKDWLGEVREEPRLLWETPAIRYATYGIAGVVVSWILVLLVGFLTPPPPPGAGNAAVTADFHVVCADPACRYNFVIQRKFGFDDFPVPCNRCKKETGVSGRRCYSESCQGRWVAPAKTDDQQKCPLCGTLFSTQP